MLDILEKLKNAVLNFDIDNAEETAKEAIDSGIDPVQAANALTEAIREVGDSFGKGDLFLPDLVCASEVLKKAFPVINEAIEKKGGIQSSLGKVVMTIHECDRLLKPSANSFVRLAVPAISGK